MESNLIEAFPNVYTMMSIYLCIFVANCKGERSFSKLKLSLNYLRNTMGQERLSSLALLSIENNLLCTLDFNNVIVHNPNESAADLNHSLDLIKRWAQDWRMSFNPDAGYYGKTSRNLAIRCREHIGVTKTGLRINNNSSAVYNHSCTTGHPYPLRILVSLVAPVIIQIC